MVDLALIGVTKRFGRTTAVDDMSLSVNHGEFVVLLGPTGAGKTTTLRLIAGLERPSAGRVLIGGHDATSWTPAARDVAFVFQQYSLYPHLSVAENLAFPLQAPGRNVDPATIRRRVGDIAELLRISHKLDDPVTQLSGGEMQRVAIGRALVRQPAILLMDEPLSSLDAKLRDDLRIELKRIQTGLEATILYVTHDHAEALTLADRIGVLDRGRLVQIAEPREIYCRPKNLYVARRLGSPQINVLPADGIDFVAAPAGAAAMALRPEDIVIGGNGHRADLVRVERLGAETVLHVRFGAHDLRALLPPGSTLPEGDSVSLSIDNRAAHFFTADGERLEEACVS
ncbi:MAG TPA: ABC transporter ATP-binding protein [Alphaproteobacteria bacterium]|nr:ABC transporter ATP-binding protein [Alphaproteobacteria bacterium]